MDLENFAIQKMKWVLVQLATINFIVFGSVRINKIVKLDTLITVDSKNYFPKHVIEIVIALVFRRLLAQDDSASSINRFVEENI